MKKAVIFDLDGTLVNSIPHYLRIHKSVLKEGINYELTNDYFFKHCNGRSAYEFYAEILKEEGHPASTIRKLKILDKKYLKHEVRHKVSTFPHVKKTLKELQKRNIKLAVATSSTRDYAKTVLEKNNIADYFQTIISRDDVTKTKPNPDIFLLARRNLDIRKKDSIVIEDAIKGFIAAKRAGIGCIGLTTSLKPEQIEPLALAATNHKNLLQTISKF